MIVAVDLANSSSRKAFLLSMDAVTGAATHQIIGGPGGIDEQFYVALRVQHGIRNVAPIVEGDVAVQERSLQVLGVDLFAEQEMRAFSRQLAADDAQSGAAAQALFRDMLTKPGAVMMSAATAASLGLVAGDVFDVIADGRKRSALLLGAFENDASAALDNIITTDIATAQAWFGQPTRLSRIDVRIADNDTNRAQALTTLLPADATLLTAAARTRTTAEMSAAFMTNLTAMSMLALLVGLFLIYNSVSFSVLQRRPLIGILRALGTTRRQIFVVVLAETASLGLVASVAVSQPASGSVASCSDSCRSRSTTSISGSRSPMSRSAPSRSAKVSLPVSRRPWSPPWCPRSRLRVIGRGLR